MGLLENPSNHQALLQLFLEEEKGFEDYFEDEGFNWEDEPQFWNGRRRRSETDGQEEYEIRPLIRFQEEREHLSDIHPHEEMEGERSGVLNPEEDPEGLDVVEQEYQGEDFQ